MFKRKKKNRVCDAMKILLPPSLKNYSFSRVDKECENHDLKKKFRDLVDFFKFDPFVSLPDFPQNGVSTFLPPAINWGKYGGSSFGVENGMGMVPGMASPLISQAKNKGKVLMLVLLLLTINGFANKEKKDNLENCKDCKDSIKKLLKNSSENSINLFKDKENLNRFNEGNFDKLPFNVSLMEEIYPNF